VGRIPNGGFRELGPINWVVNKNRRPRDPGTADTAVHHAGSAQAAVWGWLIYLGVLLVGGRLPRTDTELVILRVAHLRGLRIRNTATSAAGQTLRPRRRAAGKDLRLARHRGALAATAGVAKRHRRIRQEAKHQPRHLAGIVALCGSAPTDRILHAGRAIRCAGRDDNGPRDPIGLPALKS
jgi:hypothetical protein